MNKSESKYFNTALRMDEALIALLEEKDRVYHREGDMPPGRCEPVHLLPAL